MERTLGNFVKALRMADVRVSPAETLEACKALQLVGYRDRLLLKNTLSVVLAKTAQDKQVFDTCFERFFSFDHLADNPAAETIAGEQTPIAAESELGQRLLDGGRGELALAMNDAGRAVNVEQISLFTQKGLYTQRIMERMGLAALQNEIFALADDGRPAQKALQQELIKRRDWLRGQVRDYVEQQYLLHADVRGERLREALLRKVKLAHIERHYYQDMQKIVQRMAKKLIAVHARRKKAYKRGHLHMARTLRHNMAYDGKIFDLYWKSVKIQRPKVFAICDVSGSVSNYARFMLMFLYSLEEIIPNVRAFAFSSDLGEVTGLFKQYAIEEAIARTLHDYGGGSTDYGQAFLDFKQHCLSDVDNRSTVIILGDARNNYGNPRAEILKILYERSKRLLWLNPEPRAFWRIGDAEMQRYAAYCHQVEHCQTLRHLERVIGNILQG